MAEFVPVDPFDLRIVGVTGDLARRKLLPALFHRDRDEQFSVDSHIIAISRGDLDDAAYAEWVHDAVKEQLTAEELEPAVWERFAARLHHYSLDMQDESGWAGLGNKIDDTHGRNRVSSLATASSLFGTIAQQLAQAELSDERSRIVLENRAATTSIRRAILTMPSARCSANRRFIGSITTSARRRCRT